MPYFCFESNLYINRVVGIVHVYSKKQVEKLFIFLGGERHIWNLDSGFGMLQDYLILFQFDYIFFLMSSVDGGAVRNIDCQLNYRLFIVLLTMKSIRDNEPKIINILPIN